LKISLWIAALAQKFPDNDPVWILRLTTAQIEAQFCALVQRASAALRRSLRGQRQYFTKDRAAYRFNF
jgi:hypothetical protein